MMAFNISSMRWAYCVFTILAGFSTELMADAVESAYFYYGKPDKNAFSYPSSYLSAEQKLNFAVGKGFFKRLWVTAPSSTQAADGLGPLYNARSCITCHPGNGRGKPPQNAHDDAVSMLLRIDIPPQNAEQHALLQQGQINNIPDPVYGLQLQPFAIAGHEAEYQLHITYQETTVQLTDGTKVILQKPEYQVEHLGYGALHPQARLSPRIAQQLIGLGLLEAIHRDDMLALADPDDANGDGISGRVNMVWSLEYNTLMPGRFGHKAGNPTINQQTQTAFSHDLGISTRLFPSGAGECTDKQIKCRAAPDGNSPQYNHVEAHEQITELVNFYVKNIAVPASRTPEDEDVIAGRNIFKDIGCHQCHVDSFIVAVDSKDSVAQKQIIYPYTDLLLHDMGEGLADHRPEGMANGREWRTAPLWGIGLTPVVNGHSNYLHDGRARSLLEAILWHGGESQIQRNAVIALSKKQREQLLKFIESL